MVVIDDDYHYVALSRGSSQAVSYNPRMSARQRAAYGAGVPPKTFSETAS